MKEHFILQLIINIRRNVVFTGQEVDDELNIFTIRACLQMAGLLVCGQEAGWDSLPGLQSPPEAGEDRRVLIGSAGDRL